MPSSSSSNHLMNDFGRYKRSRQTPQVAEVPSTLQPVTPISQSDNVAQHSAKDKGSESEQEIWSFDIAKTRYSDSYLRSYVLNLPKDKLLLSHFLALSA